MDILLSLPTVLTCSVLCSWSEVCDLLKLDCACCCHSMRKKFLALFALEEFAMKTIKNCSFNAVAWLSLRNVKVNALKIKDEIELEHALPYLIEHGRSVRSLHVSQEISQKALQPAVDQCVNLTSLCLCSCDVTTASLVRNLADLQTLEFYTWRQTVCPSFEGITMRNLTSLTIAGRHWQQHHIAEVLRACPLSLRRLDISVNCVKYALEAFVVPSLQNLCSLTSQYLTDAALHAISNVCVHLTHLDMVCCDSCTDDGVLSVVRSLKLRSLGIPCTAHITNTTIRNIILYLADTLHVFCVNHEIHTAEEDTGDAWEIETLFQKCSFLRVETLQWSSHLWCEDASFAKCKFTTDLCVTHVSVTDEFLNQVAQHCMLLMLLDISDDGSTDNIPFYTCAGVRTVAEQCANLRTIMLNPELDMTLFAEIVRDYPTLCTQDHKSYWCLAMSRSAYR